MTRDVDVAVVGLGGLGSAAAWWLASRGATVAGFEQFELGHVRGASHDHSRIIRRSYHTPHYVRLTASAYDAWAAVEAAANETLVTRTGGIDLFPLDAAIDITTYTAAMDAEGVPYDVLDGAEVRRRWPAFRIGDDVAALHQEDTGIVPADVATSTFQRLAVGAGAGLHANTPVREVRSVGGEVEIVTDDGTVRAGHAVIAADAWTNTLLAPLDVHVPLTVLREQLSYFSTPRLDEFAVGRFPVWIWMDDPSFYGFPVFGRGDAVKAAEDCGGFEVDPETRTFEPSPAAEARLRSFMDGLVGDGLGAAESKTCLYTLTPDRDFVLDRVPGHPQIIAMLGAAHAFKFAAWFGCTAAELVLDGEASTDIAPFAMDRPGLHAGAARDAWLV